MKIGSRDFHPDKDVYVMGILNVTPDSFSDGGKFLKTPDAVEHALKLIEDGADMLDIGGESSRPGSDPVPAEVELERVIPVITGIRRHSDIPISIDTTKADVAGCAIDAGANLINDISAGRFDAGMIPLAAQKRVPIILMHIKGVPKSMQDAVSYDDLWGEIVDYFKDAIKRCVGGGIPEDNIILDPGIGFGKLLKHNLELIKNLGRLKVLGRPLMIGPSRKAFIGQITGLQSAERLEGTLAAVAVAVQNGASIVRVHDVKEVKRFLFVYHFLQT